MTLAPSIRHFVHGQRPIAGRDGAELFVGASRGLKWLREEVDIVRQFLSKYPTAVHDPCRRSDWPDNSSARVWHFAGHAHLRSDNAFYSALMLDDEPLFAADLRLRRNDVDLVTLAACRTGQMSGLPGEEAAGFVRALLEMGARRVVAGGWAVSDRSSLLWMEHFYRNYMNGLGASASLRAAMAAVRESYASAFHWAAYSLYGAG